MNDLDRAKTALKTGHAQDAIALALIHLTEFLTAPPVRFILNDHPILHEEPAG